MKWNIFLLFFIFPVFLFIDNRYEVVGGHSSISYAFTLKNTVVIVSHELIKEYSMDGKLQMEYEGVDIDCEVVYFFEVKTYYVLIRKVCSSNLYRAFFYNKGSSPIIRTETLDLNGSHFYRYSFDYISSEDTIIWFYNELINGNTYINLLEIREEENPDHVLVLNINTIWSQPIPNLQEPIPNLHADIFDCVAITPTRYICGYINYNHEGYYIFIETSNNYHYHDWISPTNNYIWIIKVRKFEFARTFVLFGFLDDNLYLHILFRSLDPTYYTFCFSGSSYNIIPGRVASSTQYNEFDFIMTNEQTVIYAYLNSVGIQVGIYNISQGRYIVQLTIDSGFVSLNLFKFGTRPAIAYTSNINNIYYELIIAPFCQDVTYNIYQFDIKKISTDNLVHKAKGDIYSDNLEIKFISASNRGILKFENDTIIQLNERYHLPYLVYYAGASGTTDTYEFQGYSQYGGYGLTCSITFNVRGCYSTCGTCNGPFETNCLTCAQDTKRLNGDSQRCYDYMPAYTFFDDENDRYDYCYPSCIFCTGKGNDDDHKCTTCRTSYNKKIDSLSTNCYKDPHGYYLDSRMYKKCYPTCYDCNDYGTKNNNHCKTCKTNAAFIGGQCEPVCEINECFFEGECLANYEHLVIDEDNEKLCVNCKLNNKYKIKGESECKAINSNEIINKGYILIDEEYNYYEKCLFNWYIDDNGEHKCTIDNNCNIPERDVVEDINNQCVKNCMNDTISFCNECIFQELYLYKGKCISQCPLYTKKNEGLRICEADTEEIKQCTGSACKDEAWNTIKDYISVFADIPLTLYGEDYSLQVYQVSSEYDTQNEVTNSSYINMSQCLTILEQAKSIGYEEEIIILQEDIFTDDKAYSSMKYSLYHKNGSSIDDSMCLSLSTDISYPLNPLLNTDDARYYASLGIDIYDSQSAFFNDICEPYSEEGKDITIESRRRDMYHNLSFCDNNCSYQGIDYTTNHIHCKCNDINRNNNTAPFPYKERTINMNLMKCANLLFKGDSLIHNNAFYLTSITCVIQIALTVISYTVDLLSLTSKITPSPSIKDDNSNAIDSNDYFMNQIDSLNRNNSISSKRLNTKTYISQEIDTITNAILPTSTFKKGNLFYIMNNDIDNYPYKLAKENDNRNCMSMFCKVFKEKELLLRALIKKSQFEMVSVNFSLVISYIIITFTVNALFFTPNLIAKRFYNKLTVYTYLFISLISYVISSGLFYILRYLSSFAPMLELLFSDVRGKEAIDKMTQKAKQKIKRKMILFYIIQYIVIVLSMYYLSCFCCVYHSTQNVWFICGCCSLCINLIICLLLCIIQSLLRFSGLKCKSECIYNIYLFCKNVW